MRFLARLASLLLFATLIVSAAHARDGDDPDAIDPLRLSYLEGDVSFWRPGAENWSTARLNTPLAAGDALYANRDGTLELQFGTRAFIRASEETQLSVVNQTPDFLQVKVASGRVSLDLRSLPPNFTLELDTPNSAFTIERPGYYRLEVDGDVRFITRRGGQATVIPAGGRGLSIYPSEETVVEGDNVARAESYVAPDLDDWDRWNYDRTEDLIDTASQRYLSPGIAGASDLDRYGRWRMVPDYGTVWVPEGLSDGWSPYSTGQWIWDPYYQWTWVDDAPWGWAPYHYGRWVRLGTVWAWAPGPVVQRVSYSPALVGFYGMGSGFSASIGGSVGWVALSWGEPLLPWWGRPQFIGRPYWGGWGGPRVVNHVVVNNTTIVNVNNIQYVNAHVGNAVLSVPREQFGRPGGRFTPAPSSQLERISPVRGALPVQPGPASVMVGAPARIAPPQELVQRPVVATRQPQEIRAPWLTRPGRNARPDRDEVRAQPMGRFITVPKPTSVIPDRPAPGDRAGDERAFTKPLPRYRDRRMPDMPDNASPMPAQPSEQHGPKPLREFRKLDDAPAPHQQRDSADMPPPPDTPPVRVEREDASQRVLRAPEPSAPSGVRMPDSPRAAPQRDMSNPNPVPEMRRPLPGGQFNNGMIRNENLPGSAANRVYRGQENRSLEKPRLQPKPREEQPQGR